MEIIVRRRSWNRFTSDSDGRCLYIWALLFCLAISSRIRSRTERAIDGFGVIVNALNSARCSRNL